jgi:alkylmercury lyase
VIAKGAAVYTQLAAGEPVAARELASELGRAESDVAEALGRWPGVFRDDDGRIVSFWGLAIAETAHRFRIEGHDLHTWCAWDALFIPELIATTAEVESRSPGSSESVRMLVDPDGIRDVVPKAAVVSMLWPAEAFDHTLITSFCHFVHLFPSPDAGAQWVAEHPDTFLLPVSDAHELGRIVNRRRFGAGLTATREAVGEPR